MKTSALLLLATSSIFLASPATEAACAPTVSASPTSFPLRSQQRGQKGVVVLNVKVDSSGRVADAQVLRSSGFRLLDRAATSSIRERWMFDVTSCERKDLPASNLITIEYRN